MLLSRTHERWDSSNSVCAHVRTIHRSSTEVCLEMTEEEREKRATWSRQAASQHLESHGGRISHLLLHLAPPFGPHRR